MTHWRALLLALLLLAVLGQPLLSRGQAGRIVFGRSLTLADGQRVDGDLAVFGGDVVLAHGSTVRGDVLAFGGSIEIAGHVAQLAYAPGGDITLRPTAMVAGDILAGGEVVREPGAIVRGQVLDNYRNSAGSPIIRSWHGRPLVALPSLWFGWPWDMGFGNLWVWAVQALLGSLVVMALGILAALAAPGPTRTAGEALLAHPIQSIGAGLLAGLAIGVATAVLTMTCLGAPFAALAVLALAVAMPFGWLVAGQALGDYALRALKLARRSPLLALAVGLLLLSLLAAVPCLQFLAALLAGIWGLGAATLTRFGTRRYVARPPRVTPPRR